MADPRNTGPQWQKPGTPLKATAEPPKPRDYITPALAALASYKAMPSPAKDGILAAIIVAQALDRFGEKLIDAAAVSQYKRSP